jgi:hypothetical protein
VSSARMSSGASASSSLMCAIGRRRSRCDVDQGRHAALALADVKQAGRRRARARDLGGRVMPYSSRGGMGVGVRTQVKVSYLLSAADKN